MSDTKPKNNNLDNHLFIIGGLVTLVLTLSALLNLNDQNTQITLLLFLPIPLYFLFLFLKKILNLIHVFLNLYQKPSLFFGEFSLKEFFQQTDSLFLVTIVLLSLLVSVVMYQISYAILT